MSTAKIEEGQRVSAQQPADRANYLDETTNWDRPFAYRVKLFGVGWLYKLLAPAAVILVSLTMAGFASLIGVVGFFILLVIYPLVRAHAGAERAMAGFVLGRTIPTSYRPRRAGGTIAAVRGWFSDPARWRDLLMVLLASTVGIVMVVVAEAFLFGAIFYLFYPLIVGTTPAGTFVLPLGFWRIDTFAESFVGWAIAAVLLAIWWFAAPPILRARASMAAAVLSPSRAEWERRVAEVSRSRAETVDYSAAELRRIERDLHDGAQARLVSLGMSLGMAEDLVHRDPEAAARLLVEARQATTSALGDLRTVVRGIHPPVLADRGLAGAVQALALDIALPVSVQAELAGRAPAPVETAAYFAVAECLANTMKYAHANHAWVWIGHDGRRLNVQIIDDGVGGADPVLGTGLSGIIRRISAFDGTMVLNSPPGGPTIVTLELPCELSSPRT